MKGRLPSKPPPTSVVAKTSWPRFSAVSVSLGHSHRALRPTRTWEGKLWSPKQPPSHIPPSPSGGLLLNTKRVPWAPERAGGKGGFADSRQGAVGAHRWLGVLGYKCGSQWGSGRVGSGC